jgi:predicted ATP-grasp superfamily ATP-dependent carboligase
VKRSTAEGNGGSVVLVTDGEQRAALAAVRSLGAAGHTVIVVSSRARSISGASRRAKRHFRVPAVLDDPNGFLDAIEAIVRASSVDVLLPITDQSLLSILGASDRFGEAIVPFVGLEQFKRISNKATLLEAARTIGIITPEQHVLSSPEQAATLDLAAFRFPVVIKPAQSVVVSAGEAIKLSASHAASASEFKSRLAGYPRAAYPLLVQRRIVGPGIGVFLLVWDGVTVATLGHRRLREDPPSGGVSVYREAVVADASLVAQSRALLDQFDWRGVAMVEYKVEAATGIPYLMEVNGRFWGSLQLALDAGVDFPALLVQCALGKPPCVGPVTIRSGVRSRWEWGEVRHLLARLRRSPDALALPPGAPSRSRAVLEFLSWHRADRLEICRLSDPGPFIRETLDRLRGQ